MYGILLDNGHGTRKHTVGKHSPDLSLYEGEWAREIVSKLHPILKELGFDSRILIPEVSDIALRERVSRANKIMASNPNTKWLYISIHINAAGRGDKWYEASGWSVYISNGASKESKKLAQTIYSIAEDFGLKGNRSVPPERYWQANFTVLTETKMPAILTENLFQDNRKECEWLKSEEGKETIVNLHLAAICKHCGVPFTYKVEKSKRD